MRRQIVAEIGRGADGLSVAAAAGGDDLPPAAGRSQWARLTNVVLLAGGYGLGQGAIFAVQTWLVARGAYDLLATFGTHFSFAMLSIFLIDAGATTTLARQIAGQGEGHANDEIWPLFWATVVVRASVALLLAAGAIVYALGFANDPFSRSYLLSILPGLAVWTGNAVGLLDGRRLSGVSGITGSLAFATSALGLVLAVDMPPHLAGSVLGSAFSLGYVLTVAAQWTALNRVGLQVRLLLPQPSGIRRAFLDGAALLSQFVPGQLILRVQLVMSTVYLGAESTALFVYVKQAVIATTMLVGFIMRVDFPGLVQRLNQEKSARLRTIFEAQRLAIGTALVLGTAMLLVGMAAPLIPQSNFAKAAELLMAYAPTIVVISAVTIMMQGTAAIGDYVAGAKAIAISTLVGTIVSYLVIAPLGIYALLAGEVTGHVLSLSLLYVHLRRRR